MMGTIPKELQNDIAIQNRVKRDKPQLTNFLIFEFAGIFSYR